MTSIVVRFFTPGVSVTALTGPPGISSEVHVFETVSPPSLRPRDSTNRDRYALPARSSVP